MKLNPRKVKILKLLPLEHTDYVMIDKKSLNSVLVQRNHFLVIDFTRLFGQDCEPMNLDDYYFQVWPGKRRIARKNIPMVFIS